jgi:F-type H+-transporting ATPase subunit delta
MADYASIARPYAKAVFDLAQDTNAFQAWSDSLATAAAVSQDEAFGELISDPKVDKSKLTDMLVDLCSKSLPEGGSNLFKLMIQNDRLQALPEVAVQFEELVAKAQQSVNAEVITALALSDAQKQALSTALESKLGLKVSLSETVDPDLVGGAIVKAGDLVIDGSAKGRIEKLATALAR